MCSECNTAVAHKTTMREMEDESEDAGKHSGGVGCRIIKTTYWLLSFLLLPVLCGVGGPHFVSFTCLYLDCCSWSVCCWGSRRHVFSTVISQRCVPGKMTHEQVMVLCAHERHRKRDT